MQGRRATVAVLGGKRRRIATAEKVVAGIETASEAAELTKGIPQARKIDRKIDRRSTVIRYKLIL